ncbi:MAG: DnaJ C-terminal domain-containing protein, partial [Chthoniobacteraceae bacterium]
LGTEIDVGTPDGSVRLKIPQGTQPGRKFRLKCRGLHSVAESRGDFLMQVDVVLPSSISDEERTHWEAISKLER